MVGAPSLPQDCFSLGALDRLQDEVLIAVGLDGASTSSFPLYTTNLGDEEKDDKIDSTIFQGLQDLAPADWGP